MDMRKAFDTVEHGALIDALRDHGVEETYLNLLMILYADQRGTANDSASFAIRRGVKQ